MISLGTDESNKTQKTLPYIKRNKKRGLRRDISSLKRDIASFLV